MSQRQKYRVYIAVHRGDPVDFQKFRHTALWFLPVDSGSSHYCHVRGSTGDFSYEKRSDYNPTKTQTFAKLIDVGTTKTSMTSSELTNHVKDTPVKNRDWEFNCHTWVDNAVQRMYRAGYLTKEEYEEGRDAMIDATMEAADEPSP